MIKEEMNKAISMLDEDVVADALEGAKTAPKGASKRRFVTAIIAATLALAIIAGAAVAALRAPSGNKSILPPADAEVIRLDSSAQFTPDTVYSSGNYQSAQTAYTGVPGEAYAQIGGLEISGELYESMVNSNDSDRVWALELTVSPNLYMTKDYLEKEASYWLAKYEMTDLGSIAGIYEQAKENFDFNALHEQFKDRFDLEAIFKYFASGDLEKDLLNQDISALTKKAEEIWNECVEIKNAFWSEMSGEVCRVLDELGIPYEEKDGKIIIFATEGDLLDFDLEGLKDIKLSKAEEYDIDLDKIEQYIDWSGKHISAKLNEAIAANGGKDVLFAVIAEPAEFGKWIDRAGYEEAYKAVFAELAKRPELKAALEEAAKDAVKYAEAVKTYGEELVGKYFTEEGFNKEQFDADTAQLTAKMNEMRENLYESADKIYAEFSELVRYIEVKDDGTIVLYLTEEELAALKTVKDYIYKLA